MDKASRVLRRSGVKLMSLGAGHGDLNILLSDMKEVKTAAKTFMTTQHQAALDMTKWAAHEENKAVQDVISHVAELYLVWSDVQKTFIEHLKKYRQMFEMVLEGEKNVHQAKDNLAYCTEKEVKMRKELKKCAKRAATSELRLLESRVEQAEQAKQLAQIEVSERIRENESVKLIQLKEGMLKMSGAYCEMSHKANIVFTAQKNVVLQLPDVHGQPLETIQYSGARTTQYIVEKAKEKIQAYSAPNVVNDPPPPYTPPDPARRSSATSNTSQRVIDHSRSRSGSESSQSNQAPPAYSSAAYSSAANSDESRHTNLPASNSDIPRSGSTSSPYCDPDQDHVHIQTSQIVGDTLVQTSTLQVRRGSGSPVVQVTQVNKQTLPVSASRDSIEHSVSASRDSIEHSNEIPATSSTDRLYPYIDDEDNTSNTQQDPIAPPRNRPVPSPRNRNSGCDDPDTADAD